MVQWLPRIATGILLLPVGLLLRVIGPSYRLFFWFFLVTPPSLVAWIARLRAVRAVENAYRKGPAYRQFLISQGVAESAIGRLSLPPTDKANYINLSPPDQRCVNGRMPLHDTATDESSGSSGTPYNWVRSLAERHASHIFISHFARYCFGDEPWITINAFSMGAWATGIDMGIALQRNSMVKNTGPDIDKIFNTLEFFGPGYRYLVCGYPPFLTNMIDVAVERQFPSEKYRLMAILGGEGNSEGLRDYLYQRFSPVYSGYGATDVEIGIAGETPLSLEVRREARTNHRLRNALFGTDSRLPMLFQYNPLMHYIETNVQGEIIFTITRLNILSPRIRYKIHDEGGVADYTNLRERALTAGVDLEQLAAKSSAHRFRLPFLWIYGRADSTISVMGANIHPEDIEQCLYDEPDLARVTNSFCLSLEEGPDANVRPCFSFEVRGAISAELQQAFDDRITTRLKSLNSDFREATEEYEASATPVIRLFPPGAGPFSADGARIKQARLLRSSTNSRA